MIDFLLAELRRQPGVVIPAEAGTAALVAAHQAYGGERLYVPKLPKLQTAVRIQQAVAAGAATNEEVVQRAGVSLRQVERLRVRVRRSR